MLSFLALPGCGGGTSTSAAELVGDSEDVRSYQLEGQVHLVARIANGDGQVQGERIVADASGVPVYLTADSGLLDSTRTVDGRYTFRVDAPGTYQVSCWVVASDVDSTARINLGIDHLVISDILQLPTGEQGPSFTLFPNPWVDSGTNIGFSIATGGSYRLDILDLSRAPVRNLFDGSIEAGTYSLRWDGTTNKGDVAQGNYHWAVLSQTDGSRIYGLTMRISDG